jgi:hypothetical protein
LQNDNCHNFCHGLSYSESLLLSPLLHTQSHTHLVVDGSANVIYKLLPLPLICSLQQLLLLQLRSEICGLAHNPAHSAGRRGTAIVSTPSKASNSHLALLLKLSSGKRWLVLLIQQSSLVRHCQDGNNAPVTFAHLCSRQNQATLLLWWLFPLLLIFDTTINEKWDDTPESKSELYS